MRRLLVLSLFLFTSCFNTNEYPERYFDYSGRDGCNPPNIGHGLGGDLPDYQFNTLAGMYAIESMQASICFKNWEFDLNQAKDGIVLAHDTKVDGTPLITIETENHSENIVTLEKFTSEFKSITVTKPVVIDIKNITNKHYWPSLLEAARDIKTEHAVDVWFVISKSASRNHLELCQLLMESLM